MISLDHKTGSHDKTKPLKSNETPYLCRETMKLSATMNY